MRKARKLAVLLAWVVALVGGGAAYAQWTSTAGLGGLLAGHPAQYAVDVHDLDSLALSPGGAPQTVRFTVRNTGSGSHSLSTAVAEVENEDGSAWNAGDCTAQDFAVSEVSLTPTSLDQGEETAGSFRLQMIEAGRDQNGCNGVPVPLHFTIS